MADNPSSGDGSSRLLELLRRIGREEPGAVGFGARRQEAAKHAPLVLAAALPGAAAELLTTAREAGADAAFIPLSPDMAPPTAEDSSWPVCGLAPGGGRVGPPDLDRWQAAGIDAVALRPRDALAACFSPRRHGLLALVDRHLPPDGVRAMAALSVDGYLLEDGGDGDRLTGDDLLRLTLATAMLRGPALLLSGRVVAEDLEALAGMGLAGLAVQFAPGTGAGQVRETLADLRRAVDTLDPHLRREGRERGGPGPVVIPFRGLQGQP